MAGLFTELKRRNVFRVGVAYLVAAWLVLQVLDLVLENINAPAWVMQTTMVMIGLGFPIVLGFAWAFELTPEGVKLERDVDRSKSITPQTGRRLDRLIIVVLVIAVGVLMTDKFLLRDNGEAERAAQLDTSYSSSETSRRSVAVLPFANRSPAADDVFFVDGIHDDILTQLAKISALKVISRTSVMQYRNTEKPMREIGEELDVANIIEGSVQRAGDRVRINVQLIDAESDEHLWAEIYDRELTASNIFEIQTEMATAIAGALRANLTSDEQLRLAKKPTENLEAYEAYLIGRQRMARRSVQTIAEAKAHFERAINLDPDFALAYVGISDTIQLQVDYGGLAPWIVARQSKPYIDKALELDPDSGEAYVSLGSMYEYSGEYEKSKAAYLRALELAPNYAQGRMWYGLLLLHIYGQPEAALEQFRIANVQDPLSAVNLGNLAQALEMLGRFGESRATFQKMYEIDPDYPQSNSSQAQILMYVDGRLDLALGHLYRMIEIDPGDPLSYNTIASIFWDLGDDQRAKCWLGRAIAINPDAATTRVSLAHFAALQDDKESAIEYGSTFWTQSYGAFFYAMPLSIVKHYLIDEGKIDEALKNYNEAFPEFFSDKPVRMNHTNVNVAADIADVLMHLNKPEQAEVILSNAITYLDGMPRLGLFGKAITDARVHVLRGDSGLALDTIREAVDEGWRSQSRFFLEFDPVLEPLRSHPEFDAIYREVAAENAAQLERVKAKETLETACTPDAA